MLEQIRTSIKALLDERSARQAELDAVITAAEARDDSTLSDAETASFNEARDAIKAADAELVTLQARETELVEIEEARSAASALAARVGAGTEARTVEVRVGHEPEVYRQGGEHSFLVDAYRAEFGSDFEARDRLVRHSRQAAESRAVGTSDLAGLVPPQYLLDEYAPLARASRPFSNAVRSVELPESGMTLNVPKITTGSTAAAQATQNTAVSENDVAETTLQVPVRTIAGQQDVSRQALERGQNVDSIVFADLAGAYATALDAANIAATLGTSGIETVTYDEGYVPEVGELWGHLADAVQRVNSNRFAPATAIFMHPRRWGWLTAQLDMNGRPVVTAAAPSNAMGVGKAAEYGQVVGELLGLPVITDANIPTNLGDGSDEDRIIVAKADDLLLFEEGDGAPRELRFEQTTGGSLTVKLVAYGYSAFAARFPKSIAVVGGTGLDTPTWV